MKMNLTIINYKEKVKDLLKSFLPTYKQLLKKTNLI